MSVYTKTMDSAKDGLGALMRYENPVITKELRTRMRAGRAHWTMLGYVLLLGIVVFFVYYDVWIDSVSGGVTNWAQRRVGFNMFNIVSWVQMVMISLVAPSLTAGALTLEMEQQTLEMLSLTTLSPRNIVVGKAGTGTLFCWMLLACSLPLAGMCLMFGGISPLEIAITYVLMAAWAFLLSSVGVYWSSLVTKTSAASLLTYGTAILYTIGASTLAAPGFLGGGYTEMALGALNPAWAASKALAVSHVFGIPVPLSLVSFVVNACVGVLLLTSAETHLKYHRPDKGLAVRSMLLGLSAFVTLLWFANMLSVAPGVYGASRTPMMRGLTAGIIGSIMVVIYLFLPVFATGVIRCGDGATKLIAYLLAGFNPKRIFSHDLSGATPFMLIWLGVCTAAGAIALSFSRSPAMVPDFLAVMVSAAAVTIAYCAFAILASAVATNRNLAMIITFLFIIASFAVYPVILAGYDYSVQKESLKYELAYFWPALPVVTLAEGYKSSGLGPELAIAPRVHWLAVTICYLGLAYIFVQTAGAAKRRYRGVIDE